MFKKILAATELVELCDAPIATGAQIAKQNNAKLHILHVLESKTNKDRRFVKHFRTGEEFFCGSEYEETVKQEILKSCARVLESDLHYEIKVLPGLPFEEILKWARREGIDLILMGPHTWRAKELGVVRVCGTIGSTVQGVILHARCPVMIVNRTIAKNKSKFKKIMVGVDFSESCKNALLFAIKVAHKHVSKLFVFHMAPVPPSSRYTQTNYENDIKILKQRLEKLCKMIPEEFKQEFKIWGGVQPHLEILKYAAEKDVDLIVMGSHTREKSGKWYVGSAVEGVSLRADCPVVVISDPNALLKMDD